MLRSFFASLSFRLNLLVLISILPAIGLVFYTYVQERQFRQTQLQNQALLLTQVVKSHDDQLIEGARQMLTALAQVPQVRGSELGSCQAFLSALLKEYPLYATLGVARRNGDVFCSATPSSQVVNLSTRPWMQRVIHTGKFAVGNYQIGRLTHKPVLAFGYPVLKATGQAEAVVFASLDLAWLNQLMSQVKLPEGASIILVDHQGTILARYPEPEKWVGRSVPASSVANAILTKGEGVAEVTDLDGIPRLYAFSKLNNYSTATNLYIGVGLPKTSAQFVEANQVLVLNLLWLGLFVILAKIAVVSLGGDLLILRWVRAIAQASRRLATGDLQARVSLPYGPGELSQLARTFNEMAESLERQIAERQHAEAKVRQLNESLEQRVQERTAQLEAANKELDAFSYSVSHDLRTPLRHLNGFVDALAGQLETSGIIANSQVAHYIERIQTSRQKMGQMIESLLSLSSVGRQQLAHAPVNLRQLVDTAITLVVSETEERRERSIEFTIGDLPTVMGDSTLLQQVFTNLIDNAVKFSRDRYPAKIEIGTLPDNTIFIKDNGVGFQIEQSEQMFGAFQRLHSQREFAGTGVGLAIVQRIIHRHGGRIWADSQPQQGTTFYFTLKPALAI